jgi:hypothetical protein
MWEAFPHAVLTASRLTCHARSREGSQPAYDDAAPDAEAQKRAISEALVESLCAIGDEEAIRRGVERYRDAGATNPVLTAILGTDFEPTLRAAAPVAS